MTEFRPLRQIRSFVRRGGRITSRQRTALDNLWPRYGINYSETVTDPQTYFAQGAEVTLEIGFGMGEALLSMAQLNPNENFIGIDVHEPGIGHVLDQIEKLALNNVRVMNHDAVEVLTNQIADNSLENICIFFPDPWHKKKHHKRRLINETFVNLLCKKIKAGGKIFLATDWQNYAEQILEVFNANSCFFNHSPDNTYCERIGFRPLTKFERRGQRLGHGVWDFIYEKKSTL